MNPPSIASKAVGGSLVALAGALVVAFGPDSTAGKWAAVAGTFLAAAFTIYQTKNTMTVGAAVAATGADLGAATTLTGAAAGTVVAGTTGMVGGLLDATIGRLIPKTSPKHKAGTDPGNDGAP